MSCLILFSVAAAYAVFDQGGRTSVGWNISLLILGAGAVLYLLSVSTRDRSPFLLQLPGWAVLLPPVYVGFQLLPLPVPLLDLLSPTRAGLVESLMRITQTPAFAPLSIDSATTDVYLLRALAYCITAFIICEISWSGWNRRSWAPVIPLICIAAFEACLGIVQFASGGDVSGTYRSHDHFAGLLEMVLPLAAAYGISLVKDSGGLGNLPVLKAVKAGAALVLAGAMLVGLVYSMSKMGFAAGLGGLFAVGALTGLSMFKGTGRWLTIAGLVAFFTLVFVFLPTDRLANAYGSFFANDPASAEGRAPIWTDSRRLLAAYPVFGTGLGTYSTAFLKYQTTSVDLAYTYAHNDYLELASELGVVGSLIFAGLFLMAFIKAAWATFSEDWDTRLLGLGLAGAMTAIGIHSLVDFNLYIPANALLLSWVVGIAIGIPSPSPRDDTADELLVSRSNVFRLLSCVTLRALPVLFGCALVVYATAWIAFATEYKGDARAESVFCRFGVCGSTTAFADGTSDDAGNRSAVPFAALVDAVKNDPAAPHRWCDLGDSFLRSGRIEQARYCYSNALTLGPEIPPVLVRSAAFYRAVGDDQRSLELGARVVENSDLYRPEILDWYRSQDFSVSDVLSHGLPTGPLGAHAYLRYWIGRADSDNARITWDWILGHRNADLPITRDYVNFLFGNHNYQEASTAWALFVGDRADGYRKSDWVFNGDFENEPSGVPLDWEIGSIAGQAETSLDSTVAYTGTHSLRIRFAGTENVNYSHVAQRLTVPAGTYRFTAFIRTEGITTDRGIFFRIFDPELPSRLDAKTEWFMGTTTGWVKAEQIIRVRETTRLVEIQVIREPTMKFDNKVSGTAWIDTVSLSRIG